MQTLGVEEKAFYSLDAQQVAKEFNVDLEKGLSAEEVHARLEKYGPNVLSGKTAESIWILLFRQLANSMTLVLLAATVLSFITKDYAEAIVVFLIIIANTFTGLYQEMKAEKTMSALRSMSSPTANVLRDGEQKTIPTIDLVPGDILLLKNGDNIGADCRLIYSQILGIDEALLTGETHQVEKHTGVIGSEKVPVGDQFNMVFSSTTVTQGRGKGLVVRTGMESELGKIAKSMFETKTNDSKTPLQRSLDNMGTLLIFVSGVLALIVFAVNDFVFNVNVVLYAVAVAIAVIPEGLMAVVTLTMALGMRQMSKQRVLVRKLIALESLGRVTNVCSDKTGTLTQAVMTVTKIWLPGNGVYSDEVQQGVDVSKEKVVEPHVESLIENGTSSFQLLGKCASLCNMAELKFDSDGNLLYGIGDATEIALQKFAHKYDLGKKTIISDDGYDLWVEHTFDSTHKRMAVVYKNPHGEGAVVFVKGATEKIMGRCVAIQRANKACPMSYEELANEILPVVQRLSSQGMRTISLAMRYLENVSCMDAAKEIPRGEVESKLMFLGLAGITDPPRPESRASVDLCHEAGITVHMLTGDHLMTAVAIARQVGILPSLGDVREGESLCIMEDENCLVMTSSEFDHMTDNQIDALTDLPKVIARCSPQTKVRMIQALHRRGCIVAMTGDGVNDSPSLKLADVGISMGQNSSDVAKQASDIVLTDNNFASIVNAIAEGRRIFRNIQRFVAVLIGGNVAELFVLMLGLSFVDSSGHSVFPLSPIQILVNNMVTGTPSALALGMEKKTPDAMKRPPRSAKLGLFDAELVTDIIFYGCIIGAITLFDFYATIHWFGNGVLGSECDVNFTDRCNDLYQARGVVFAALTILMLLHTYNCRDIRGRMWNMAGLRRFFDNPSITNAVVIGCSIAIVSLYIPGLNDRVFKQIGFVAEWSLVFVSILVFIVISELYKIFKTWLLPPFH